MANSFDVLFLGLFCFKRRDRVAVMPDARVTGDSTIPPHIPFLVIDPRDITDSSGWQGNDPNLMAQGIYVLDKCTISITKATVDGPLDASQHDTNIFKIALADGSFQFDAGGDIIATIRIGQGKLELLRRPDANANVTRLRVQHDGEIVVTIQSEEGSGTSDVTMKPGSDVSIVNLPLAFDASKHGDPGQLYRKITTSHSIAVPGPFHVPGMPAVGKNYEVFKIGLAKLVIAGIGCCPPL